MMISDSSFWRFACKAVSCFGLAILTLTFLARPATAQEPAPPADQQAGQPADPQDQPEEPAEKVTEEITVTATLREEKVQDVPFSVAAPTRRGAAQAGRRFHRRDRADHPGLHRPEPRPRPEPGRHPRRLLGPDRPRPAGRQGAGRRLSRRLRHLALALHAGHRPLRHVARRGAARTAGHPVRRRLGLGHDALHHQPAPARRARDRGRADRQHPDRRRGRRQRQGGGQRAARRQDRPALHRLLQQLRRVHRRRAARPEHQGRRQQRRPRRRPPRAPDAAERPADDHPADPLPEGGNGRLEPRGRLQHPRQSLHHHPAGGGPGRARAVHPVRGAVHRRVPARRPQHQLRLRQPGPDLDHLLHGPRHPGRPRRHGADREHHRRQHRPAGERLHPRRAARRRDDRQGADAGAPPRRRAGPAELADRASSTAPWTATTARASSSPASRP